MNKYRLVCHETDALGERTGRWFSVCRAEDMEELFRDLYNGEHSDEGMAEQDFTEFELQIYSEDYGAWLKADIQVTEDV